MFGAGAEMRGITQDEATAMDGRAPRLSQLVAHRRRIVARLGPAVAQGE